MNNIEKAQLIKELRELILSLEHQALTLFETAKSKKRIQDICFLFQDLGFEQFLPDNLAEYEIKVKAAGPMQLPTASTLSKEIPNYSIALSTQQNNAIAQALTTQTTSSMQHKIDDSHEPTNCVETLATLNTSEQSTEKAQLTSVQLGKDTYDVHRVEALANFNLYQLTHFNSSSCAIVFHEQHADNLNSRPIYLAEQYNEMGCFKQYLAYFGSTNTEEALDHIQQLQAHQQLKISAIRKTIWAEFEKALHHNEQLFHCFSRAHQIESHAESGVKFIPRSLVYGQKFILFEEVECQFDTPIVFLEEREKNRLICGENRLALNSSEAFIPFVRYQRQQGLSWQIIQETIAELPHPIVTIDLIRALNTIINRT